MSRSYQHQHPQHQHQHPQHQHPSGGSGTLFPPNALPGPMAPGWTQNFQGGIHQHAGEGSLCPNFIFQTPGTYNLELFGTPNEAGAGSKDTRTSPLPYSAGNQTTGFAPAPWQGHNMGSQTSPGLKGNFGNGQSSSKGGGSQSQP